MSAVLVLLCVGHLLSQFAKFYFGLSHVYGLVDLFDMDEEGSLPTFFAGVQLLICSTALTVIGCACRQARDRFSRHWQILAVVFFLLALDELVSIHELTIRLGWELIPSLATGILYWAWIVPAAVLVVVVCIAYTRFVFSYLPAFTRRQTVLGATLFVSGALGVEMFEARHVQRDGMDNMTMGVYVLVEETLEKAGILVFLSGILEHLRLTFGSFTVQVDQPAQPS